MKNKTRVSLALGLWGLLVVLSGVTGAQEQKSQLYSITEIAVKPAMIAKFETAIKKEIELGYPLPFQTYSRDDYRYYILMPIENYAGIDAINKAEKEWAMKIGKEYVALMESVAGAIAYYQSGVVRLLPELSYVPKKPKFKPEEQEFITWGLASVEFGKEKEFSDVCRQFVEACESKDTSLGWNMYVVEAGEEAPFYFWAEGGKSAAEYYAENDKVLKKMGEDKFAELWGKFLGTVRKFETKTGQPRPDLSNMPKD